VVEVDREDFGRWWAHGVGSGVKGKILLRRHSHVGR
jgi:hypothetical protein